MKIQKIAILIMIFSVILTHNTYAKYRYDFDETIIQLTRDANPPICHVTYSIEEWTNQNVMITITANKEIEQVSGFVLSEDKKVLTKEVSENETNLIKVRDFSGNETEVEYEVSNIDKEPPQIIGCENGGIYKKPLVLDYKDNVEVKEIRADKYAEKLTIEYKSVYHDSYYFYGIDRTKSTLSLKVLEYPRNTVKYKYYANNQLYATTTDTSYTFTGLKEGSKYQLKVQAIDAQGNVLDEIKQDGLTSYYGKVTSTKSRSNFLGKISDLSNQVSSIRYAVWNYYDSNNYRWYDAPITNKEATINFGPFEGIADGSYVVNAYLFDAKGNALDVLAFSIDFNSNYVEKTEQINPYKLTIAGNYQIFVSDIAGNETIYDIKVQ